MVDIVADRGWDAALAAGLPPWAPAEATGPDGPRLAPAGMYAWATEAGPRALLVGDARPVTVDLVIAHGERILAGTLFRRPGAPPLDLGLPVALVRIGPGTHGSGPLGRPHLLPLGELVAFALDRAREVARRTP